MAKTVLKCCQGDAAYYIWETYTSGGAGAGRKARLSLCRTSQYGQHKDGRVSVNRTFASQTSALQEKEWFEACDQMFLAKRARPYQRPEKIRGPTGRWEGEAFPMRPGNQTSETVTDHEGRKP